MKQQKSRAASFPFPVLVVLAYLCMGFFWELWNPGWLLFLTIPVYYYTVNIIEKINNNESLTFWKLLPYPLLCTLVYVCIGIFWGLWHPGWLIFLTIPIWSFFVAEKKADKDDET